MFITLDANPGCPIDQTDVVVNVEESGMLRLDAGTFVTNGEGGVEAKGGLTNLMGGAERIEAAVVYGTSSR